uniref:Glutamate receptor ionotropic, kainate 2 n=1 Tax=Haemonchus contortus TaxID=6289 RepID=A0A7I4XTQ7_HAECO
MTLRSWILLLSFAVQELIAYKIGAVLREKEDAHIAAAIQYTVEWLNQRGIYGEVEYLIEYLDDVDHYNALKKACSMFERDRVVSLIGGSHSLLNAQLERLTDQLDIPLLTASDDVHPSAGNTKIAFFPRAQLFEAIVDLFRYWRWNRITIVYEEDDRIRRIEPLLESDAYSNIRFQVIKVQNKDYMRAAKEVKEMEECRYQARKDCNDVNRVLLDLNPEHTYNFLLAALQMGLIDLKHWFLLTNMELSTMSMDLFSYNHARYVSPYPVDGTFLIENKHMFNFTQFQQHVRQKWNMKTANSRNLKMMEAVFTFDAIYTFANVFTDVSAVMMLDDLPLTMCRKPTRNARRYQHGRTLIDRILENNLRGLSGDLRRLSGNAGKSNYSLRIQLIGYNGVLEDIGFWEPATEVHVNMSGDSRAQLQRNVQVSDELKPHFRVTTIMERPYVMLKKNHYELYGNMKFEGFCIDLLAELSRDLGFTYAIHAVADGKYGNDVHGNGSWDGMIGEILRGEAEMAVAPLTVNFRRSEVVSFTKPFLSLGISILYKVPDDYQPDLFSFLNPLSWQIWLAILAAIVCVTLGMYTVSRVTPYEWNLNFSCCTAHQPHPGAAFVDSPVELSNNYSFWNTLWYVTSTMLKGGCDFGPRAVSTRLLGGTWWVFTLVIISAYTANLAAVLTVSRPFIPIKNLDDLANQTTISYGTIKGGSTMQFFQESKIGSHAKMWEYMKNRDVFVKDNREGVERVVRRNFAYLMESTSLEFEVSQNCNLTQIGGVLGSKGYGIALQKKSEWTDRISRQILLYQKRGIIEMKKSKWWRSKGATCTGASSAVKQQRFSLSLHNVAGLFIILGAGLLFGVVTVIVELFIRCRQMAKKENISIWTELISELRFALNLNIIEQHRSRKKNSKLNGAVPSSDQPPKNSPVPQIHRQFEQKTKP